jgi:hypothetical protein
MRYIASAMRLETLLQDFRYDWLKLSAALGTSAIDAVTAATWLDRIKAFCLAVRGEVEQETQAWIAEFRSNLAQLEKETKQALDDVRAQAKKEAEDAAKQLGDAVRAGKPGAIQVTIKTAATLDKGFAIDLGGITQAQALAGKEYAIGNVPPGIHVIGASAEATGKTLRAAKAVTVQANEIAAVVLEL